MKNDFSKNTKTSFTLGFALFAMFFGAGNLILPPLIGVKAGENWLYAVAGFFTTGIVAPFLGVITIVLNGVKFTDLGTKVNPVVVSILALLIMLCIGPLVAIPRTGATTYEVGIQPLLPGMNSVLFSIIFFSLVFLLTVSKSKIVDLIGNILTPFLLVSLGLLVLVGVFNAENASLKSDLTPVTSFVYAFHEGYQTLDVLASVVFAGIIIGAAIEKGYTQANERFKITLKAGLISMSALLFIYGGLIYLGAHAGYNFDADISRTDLLLNISRNILGVSGTLVVSTAVAMACLTTAIALCAAMGSFVEEFTSGKIKYGWAVALTCIFSGYFSIHSVDEIISYAVVILGFVYPITFTLILTVLIFGKKIFLKGPYIAALLVTTLLSLVPVLEFFGAAPENLLSAVNMLPLAEHDLGWIIPSLLTFGTVYFFTRKDNSREAM
ncbi:branched-chain amino acid transport system II carrier protein [Planobacterium oryzisoli]|uniref:Branched-chain amino acid transport system II carrier protein n=1 Tax=Planobacterium oryzisoli TaxID=2771435 RepID=A0A930YUC8_9FLAO|nr:branched-chain amino acid transport system II carrier protein [Planobacterium oryzisoli]MBF5026520.1 branched-chain amino acid transport system II carrier protein [Planobacterium oryzisoli]